MSFEACAGIVERGDPDRFLAVMAAPVAARRVLFPIYAFNAEVARAPWVTEEPMIAEMRLQWWREALEEIASGGTVRRHEITMTLADVLDAKGARGLDRLVAARRWDVYKDGFEDEEHFKEYLDATAGELMWQAARALGAVNREDVIRFGRAAGVARYLSAVSALEVKGRVPLLDGRESAIAKLAREALKDIVRPISNNPAFLEAWQAKPLLLQIAKEPWRVAQGTVGISAFRAKWRLLCWS
ncbi:MAG: squalene/phytoene synthase family protein [Octadecabacter sp.]|nr:squalene/phytoene synthase family protein [Octadecabacter sp.]